MAAPTQKAASTELKTNATKPLRLDSSSIGAPDACSRGGSGLRCSTGVRDSPSPASCARNVAISLFLFIIGPLRPGIGASTQAPFGGPIGFDADDPLAPKMDCIEQPF